jgi:hypothetical protein
LWREVPTLSPITPEWGKPNIFGGREMIAGVVEETLDDSARIVKRLDHLQNENDVKHCDVWDDRNFTVDKTKERCFILFSFPRLGVPDRLGDYTKNYLELWLLGQVCEHVCAGTPIAQVGKELLCELEMEAYEFRFGGDIRVDGVEWKRSDPWLFDTKVRLYKYLLSDLPRKHYLAKIWDKKPKHLLKPEMYCLWSHRDEFWAVRTIIDCVNKFEELVEEYKCLVLLKKLVNYNNSERTLLVLPMNESIIGRCVEEIMIQQKRSAIIAFIEVHKKRMEKFEEWLCFDIEHEIELFENIGEIEEID